MGQRVQKIQGTTTTKYICTGSSLLFTTDTNNAKLTENVLSINGQVIASQRFNSTFDGNYYFYNQAACTSSKHEVFMARPVNFIDLTGHMPVKAATSRYGDGGNADEDVVPEPADDGTIDNPGTLPNPISPSEDYINTGYIYDQGKSDIYGLLLLEYYLYGLGNELYIINDRKVTEYLCKSYELNFRLEWMIKQYAEGMLPRTEHVVAGSCHMDIVNGSRMSGYNFLSGTDATVGDFQYSGIIKKDVDGNIDAKMNFMWNDIMNVNNEYTEDKIKGTVAEIITFGLATEYTIHIFWTQSFSIPVE